MKKILIICLFSFILVGCGKKVITTTEFAEKAAKDNYTVYDVTPNFSYNENIKTALVIKNEAYQIEFYETTDEYAKEMYDKNYNSFLDYENNSTHTETKLNNYQKYTLKNDTYYLCIIRNKNTFFYTKAPKESKKDIENFIKELGL